MTRMPKLSKMEWNYKDELHATAQQAMKDSIPETTWYFYDGKGIRVRKVTERQDGTSRMRERVYLGDFEVFRKFTVDESTALERQTLHVMDCNKRIDLVETCTQSIEPQVPRQLIPYQFTNQIQSVSLELDNKA